MIPQTTLARSSTRIEGWQLDRDAPASVRFHPAPAHAGLVFTRSDLPGSPQVECRVEHVTALPRWSSLECGGLEVHHTEHILAALAGCGLDNVVVELDGDRIPVVSGGSCLAFCRVLLDAGLVPLPEPRCVFLLKRPIDLAVALDLPAGAPAATTAQRLVLGLPASGFSASYLFQVPALPDLRLGFAEFVEERDDFHSALASARTYYLRTEQSVVSELLSGARHEYMVIDRDSSQEDVDEVARHKLVDFWGDLRLLGKPVWGRFAAFRTGHRFHHDLIRTLVNEDYLETVELSEGRVTHDYH